MPELVPPDLLRPLRDLASWLASIPAPGMIVGGVAVPLAGKPRFTQDNDGLLDSHPDANLDVVRRWVREFATATRDVGIAARF